LLFFKKEEQEEQQRGVRARASAHHTQAHIRTITDATDMTEPDPTPTAAPLDEGAQLAAAANAKRGDALAIAEQARRDAVFNEDRRWFKSRPDRSFRARLATQQEIEDLHKSAWPPGRVPAES
jgi:hypothetical protein